MVSMVYSDHSRLKILMFCTLAKILIFKSSGLFNFHPYFGGYRFQTTLTLIRMLLRAVRPDLCTHHTI